MDSHFLLYRFRKAGYEAIDAICDYYKNIHERPVMAQVEPDFLRNALPRAFVHLSSSQISHRYL